MPLNPRTADGLLRLLFVPSGTPVLVPAKPATVDGLFRLELVPSTPPVAVPVNPDTVDGLLKLAFSVGVGTTTAPFDTFVANPAPVEVVEGVVAMVVDALVVVMVVEAFVVVIVVDGTVPLARAVGTGATLDTCGPAGPPTAAETIASAAVPAAVPTETLWASARIPESASAVPMASVIGVRA